MQKELTKKRVTLNLPLTELTRRRQSSDSTSRVQPSRSGKENSSSSKPPSKRKLRDSSSSGTSQSSQKRPRPKEQRIEKSKCVKMDKKTLGPFRIATKFSQNSVSATSKNNEEPNPSIIPLSHKDSTREKVYRLGGAIKGTKRSKVILKSTPMRRSSAEERTYYAQRTNLPMDKDHPDDANGLAWELEIQRKMLDEFIDVNEDEKKMFYFWNCHCNQNPCNSKVQMPDSLRKFVATYGEKIKSHNLYRNFLLHLAHLENWDIITPECMAEIIFAIQEKFCLIHAIEKGKAYYQGKVIPVVTNVEEPTDECTVDEAETEDNFANKLICLLKNRTSHRFNGEEFITEQRSVTMFLPKVVGDEIFLCCRKLLEADNATDVVCPCCLEN